MENYDTRTRRVVQARCGSLVTMPAVSIVRDMLYFLGALVSSPLWGYRMIRTGKWRTDWRGRFGHATVAPSDAKTLLIHAVSVGEVNAIRQLVSQLQQSHGRSLRILISVTTDTGTARARELYGTEHVVRYPLDFSRCVRRFLDAVRPHAVLLVELEVWPTFVQQCSQRNIPVAVINGRLSERSFRRYALIRRLVAPTFRRLHTAGVQDDAYGQRFIGLGVPKDRVAVMGTMKWDTARIVDALPGMDELAAAMGMDRGRPLIVCGSTGPGEEQMILDALRDVDGQILFVPRKPERFEEVARLLGDPVRRTRWPDGTKCDRTNQRLFLLDTLGELGKAYCLADQVIVGRTFADMGGSDMMEPIALGRPTIVGPSVRNFESSMRALLADHGVAQVPDAEHLRKQVQRWLAHPEEGRAMAERGRQVIRNEQGATARYAQLAERLLGL